MAHGNNIPLLLLLSDVCVCVFTMQRARSHTRATPDVLCGKIFAPGFSEIS